MLLCNLNVYMYFCCANIRSMCRQIYIPPEHCVCAYLYSFTEDIPANPTSDRGIKYVNHVVM